MRTPLPPIHEAVAALKERLPHAHDGHKKPRVQMRYLLARGQAQTRQDVARLLGVPRKTMSRWLALYAAGGLEALVATSIPLGKPVSLAPAVLASLERALHRPEGCGSYEALRPWGRRTHGVEVKDKTLDTLGRTRFKAQPKVARPSPTKQLSGHAALPGQLSRTPPARDSRHHHAPRAGL
jgi:Helix-turn-helix domain